MITIKQIQIILKRLKKPSVILSIVSQAIAILAMLNIHVDNTIVMAIATAICSILTTAGILSNPSTVKNGYGDDIYVCSGCGKSNVHTLINGKLVCNTCGSVFNEVNDANKAEIINN